MSVMDIEIIEADSADLHALLSLYIQLDIEDYRELSMVQAQEFTRCKAAGCYKMALPGNLKREAWGRVMGDKSLFLKQD